MEISDKDAFKLGFMSRCAEEGLTGADLDARLAKAAEFNKTAAPGGGGGGASSGQLYKIAPTTISPPGIPGISDIWNGGKQVTLAYLTALGIPFGGAILGGSALGYGAGKMVEPPVDDDELRAQELAATYKLYADKAKQRKKLRQYRLRDGNL